MSPAGSADSFAAAALLGAGLLAAAGALLRPRRRSERAAREGGTIFLPEPVMHAGYGLLTPLVRLAVRCRVSPAAITWTSLVLGAVAGMAVARGYPGWAAWGLALGGLCDMLDGTVARAIGGATAAGAALDSTLDRYVEGFFLAGLLWYFQGSPWLQLLALATLLGSFMVTYSTAKAQALGVTPPRGWMKRPERVVWFILGAMAAGLAPCWNGPPRTILAVMLGLVACFANLSAIVRLTALHRSLRGS